MSRLVTLLTDFGTADGYVGEVKGTLLTLAPGATLVDIAHDVPAGDVAAACYVLGRTWRSFPPGTVHLAVVDPGVGSKRRALAAENRLGLVRAGLWSLMDLLEGLGGGPASGGAAGGAAALSSGRATTEEAAALRAAEAVDQGEGSAAGRRTSKGKGGGHVSSGRGAAASRLR